jgi:hypothetical protein
MSRMAPHKSLGAALLLACALGGAAAQAGTRPDPPPYDPTLPPDCQRALEFDPGEFGNATKIDNKFLPLVPGRQLVLEGLADRGPGVMPHTVTFTVTDLIKVIEGVPSRVVWDVDENDGEIVEAELAFFAQDDAGNVWNLGEYPEEYEDGVFLGAPNTWIAGLEDAEAGIHMLDYKDVGDTYLQGFAPEIDFLDCALVFGEDVRECDIPAAGRDGCFDNGVVTHERSPLDEGNAIQTKFHAPYVGIAKVGALNDPEGETLVLRERIKLDPASLAAARAAALSMDRRAYSVSEVYCQTEPIAPNPPTVCTAGQPVAPVSSVGQPVAPVSSTGGTQTAPAAPVPAQARKARSRRKSCYAKRSRSSARRNSRRHARRLASRSGTRAVLKKMTRKTCAERLSRR